VRLYLMRQFHVTAVQYMRLLLCAAMHIARSRKQKLRT